MKLIHDIPANKGVANGIKRAKQLTNFRYTPVRALPAVLSYDDMEGEHLYKSWKMNAWFPRKGMIYSSVLRQQKFVGFNVSFETFVTALSDPDSVIYKYNVNGEGRKNANCWYGVVCSCFVSYVLDMKERWICRNWPTVKGVNPLGQPALEDLELLDFVLNVKKHIAIITDIVRDENGKVCLIEVSESTLPVARATYFTPDEFRGYWYDREFNIYRKEGKDRITYTPSPFVRVEADPERNIEADPVFEPYEINKDILPDQGNVSNYKEKQDIILDVLNDKWDGVRVTNEKGESELFEVKDGKAEIPMDSSFHKPGFYTAVAADSKSGKGSAPCAFGITGLTISPADGVECSACEKAPAVIKPAQKVKIGFCNPAGDEIDMIYIHAAGNSGERCRFHVTKEDKKNGFVTIEFPDVEDTYFVFESADNKYGEYASNYLYFKTEK